LLRRAPALEPNRFFAIRTDHERFSVIAWSILKIPSSLDLLKVGVVVPTPIGAASI
jgi:hypothetical protein